MKWNAFAVLLTLALAAAPGFASPIAVNNFSFETITGGVLGNACGAGCSFSVAAIPGWANTGDSGQFRPGSPGNNSLFNAVPDGITVAYTNGPTISQLTGATVQLGVVYTLLVDIGSRKDLLAAGFDGTADLLIGGVTTILATGSQPTLGNFSTFTATYTGLSGDVGK
jgi:hypothetical protein